MSPARPGRRKFLVAVGTCAALAGCLEVEHDRSVGPLTAGVTNVAHQGGNLLRPGNTMPAFEHALEMGADMLEMDLELTADEEIVVIHDETVDRTTDGSGRVDEFTLAEIKQLDAAYHWPFEGEERPYRGAGIEIPTLQEVLETFPETPLLLEPKTAGVDAERLVGTLEDFGRIEDTVIAAFEDEILEAVREIEPDVATGIGPREGRELLLSTRPDERRYEAAGEVVFPPYQVCSESIVERAHRVGLAVVPWTVNERNAMERQVAHGVDGIITDDPATLSAVLDRA